MSKKKAPKLNVPRPIIALSVLSLIGIMMSGMSDFSWYTGIDALITGGFEEGSPAIEVYNAKKDVWEEAGIDVSTEGLMQLRQLFLAIGLLNIPVLLGVVLMFYRVKIGFQIYTVSQLAYAVVPLVFLGGNFYPHFRTLHYGDVAVTILFIIMWGIQWKEQIKNQTSTD